MSDAPPSQKIPKKGQGPARGIDNRGIDQRIEEDRERHKRQRENIWAIPRTENAEMSKLWEETSDFGEDDDRMLTEEADEFQKEMDMQMLSCQHQAVTNGNRS